MGPYRDAFARVTRRHSGNLDRLVGRRPEDGSSEVSRHDSGRASHREEVGAQAPGLGCQFKAHLCPATTGNLTYVSRPRFLSIEWG